MRILGLIWCLFFTVFDVYYALQAYNNNITLRFWLFIIGAVIMFICFLLYLVELIKED